MISSAHAPAAHVRPAPRILSPGRNPKLELHLSRSGKMVTVTTSVAAGAQGHYTAGASGDGLGNWAAVGSSERFTGVDPGDWTLTATWVGSGGWATETLTRRVDLG
jgi:hypothetical protein